MMPLVSISIPVYNGENYIENALNCLLNQTYHNIEIIITDNDSTDNTSLICKSYEKKDQRIQYYKNKRNVGASNNYKLGYKLAKGKYFQWMPHDDYMEKDFIEKCVFFLETYPEYVLCNGLVNSINEKGKKIKSKRIFNFDLNLESNTPHIRYGELLDMKYDSWSYIFGVMNKNILEKTQLLGGYHNSDRTLLLELSLYGKFKILSDTVYYWRDHDQAYTNVGSKMDRSKWWTGKGSKSYLIYWKALFEYIRSLFFAQVDNIVKIKCVAQLGTWILTDGWYRLFKDIMIILFGDRIIEYRFIANFKDKYRLFVK